MKWSDIFVQRFVQDSMDLSNQVVEVHKLRQAIRSAEAQRLKDSKNGGGGLRSRAGATSKVKRPQRRLTPYAGAEKMKYEWKAGDDEA